MGWESRKGGGRYYTRSKKIGGRVVREYVGTGLIGELSAQIDADEQQDRDQAQAALRTVRDADRAQERALGDVIAAVDAALTETLILAHCYKHKGQWRRRRVIQENRPGEV